MSRNICAAKKAQKHTSQKTKWKHTKHSFNRSTSDKGNKTFMSFLYKENTVHALFILWKSRKSRNRMAVCDKNIGYTLSNVTNRKSSLEAKLFPNTEHLLWATRLCPMNERLCENFNKYVTCLRSRFHFDLPQRPPERRRTQTGLSESQRTRAETCFVEGRRERSGRGPAHSSPTLRPPGPSGLCELCAGACWGRTWCGRPGRTCRRWTSSQGPSWLWIPRESPGPPQRLRCRLKRATRAPARRQVCGEI